MKTLEDILARHPFWNDLPPQYLPLLIECASIEEFAPGEQIFKKGYDADHFYLIQHGKVALETEDVPGEGFITIRTLDAGDALGWSGLFPPHQCQFSARAVEPTEAVVFKAAALRNKAKETPAFGYDLALRVGGMILRQLQATRTRLLDMLCGGPHSDGASGHILLGRTMRQSGFVVWASELEAHNTQSKNFFR